MDEAGIEGSQNFSCERPTEPCVITDGCKGTGADRNSNSKSGAIKRQGFRISVIVVDIIVKEPESADALIISFQIRS